MTLEQALSREPRVPALPRACMRDGMIWWSWTAEQTSPPGQLADRSVWSLRIPLSADTTNLGHFNLYRSIGSDDVLLDINYLCTLFQEQLARATLRLLIENAPQQAKVMAARA